MKFNSQCFFSVLNPKLFVLEPDQDLVLCFRSGSGIKLRILADPEPKLQVSLVIW
jgi:hypothetical protein